jgi:hypothetical protein
MTMNDSDNLQEIETLINERLALIQRTIKPLIPGPSLVEPSLVEPLPINSMTSESTKSNLEPNIVQSITTHATSVISLPSDHESKMSGIEQMMSREHDQGSHALDPGFLERHSKDLDPNDQYMVPDEQYMVPDETDAWDDVQLISPDSVDPELAAAQWLAHEQRSKNKQSVIQNNKHTILCAILIF